MSAEKACDGGRVLEGWGDMAECAHCGRQVRWDLREHRLFGFGSCSERSPDPALREQLQPAAVELGTPTKAQLSCGFALYGEPALCTCGTCAPEVETRAVRAEALWEELGGDLCICQRADVPHWCESCQRRIDLIATAFRRLDHVRSLR